MKALVHWYVNIVGDKASGAMPLHKELETLTRDGWSLVTILTNGVDRWTVVAKRVEEVSS